MEVDTPSINAVPNRCVAYIDRRLTFGEDPMAEIERIRSLIPSANREAGDIVVYTGFVKVVDKIFPAWALEEEHPLVQAALTTCRAIGLPDHRPGKWDFSTNGIYWAGYAGIPTVGFAPGDEKTAHTVLDSVPIADVVKSTAFYALLPGVLASQLG